MYKQNECHLEKTVSVINLNLMPTVCEGKKKLIKQLQYYFFHMLLPEMPLN